MRKAQAKRRRRRAGAGGAVRGRCAVAAASGEADEKGRRRGVHGSQRQEVIVASRRVGAARCVHRPDDASRAREAWLVRPRSARSSARPFAVA